MTIHPDASVDECMEEISALEADNERLRAALAELLSGHDNLYIAHFGPGSNPHDDIAAKPARRALLRDLLIEVEEWKQRWAAERRDHEATIRHFDKLMNEDTA